MREGSLKPGCRCDYWRRLGGGGVDLGRLSRERGLDFVEADVGEEPPRLVRVLVVLPPPKQTKTHTNDTKVTAECRLTQGVCWRRA
eukprot:3940266-Rhodomonas_salina.1